MACTMLPAQVLPGVILRGAIQQGMPYSSSIWQVASAMALLAEE